MKLTFTITLGALCGDIVKEIKRASLAAGVTCEHAKGAGWIDAKHTFMFEGDEQTLRRLMFSIKTWLTDFQ